jgi:lipoprotein-anchoring transpeptidase ErfK/SrfK
MASKLRPPLLLPALLCLLAASLVFYAQQESATAAEMRATAAAPNGSVVAHVKRGRVVAVRSGPNGRVLTSLSSRTEFGSQQVLSVVRERRRRWLGVTMPQLPNGRLGWIDARSHALRYSRAPVTLEIDLSRRQLLVRRSGQVVRRLRVSIGRAGSPTPTGRFAVTDKLPGARYSSVYGCCILALSGTQPNLPPGWTGGNRLAVHGTPDQRSVGGRASAGCLHARDRDLRHLMKTVPLGAPVRIHA